MNRSYSAEYSGKRDKQSSMSDNEFIHYMKEDLSKIYNVSCDSITVIKHSNTQTDFDGTDFTFILRRRNGEYKEILVQKKALEYCGYDTVTTTKNELIKYKKNSIKNGYLFHCYYLKNNPEHIIKYCIMSMSTYLKQPHSFRKNKKTQTDFAYIKYKDIESLKDVLIVRNPTINVNVNEGEEQQDEIDELLDFHQDDIDKWLDETEGR